MIRLTAIAMMFTVSICFLATPQANAQSPDPALLAPGGSGRMMAPPRSTQPQPTYTFPRPGGTPPNMRSRRGRRLSHPRVHGL
jgi:hypothetical protein